MPGQALDPRFRGGDDNILRQTPSLALDTATGRLSILWEFGAAQWLAGAYLGIGGGVESLRSFYGY